MGSAPRMTDVSPTPQEGVAHALTDLSEQTLVLVRQELDAAQQEMVAKAKRWLPAAGLLAVAAGGGVFATASSYRLVMRLLEKMFPPTLAALMATAGFGGLAAAALGKGREKIRQLPPPVPSATARKAGEAAATAVDEVRSGT